MRFTAWNILTVVSLIVSSVACDGLTKETPPLPALPDTGGDVAADTAFDTAADTAADTTPDVEVDGSGAGPAFVLGRMVDVSGATFTMGSPDIAAGAREIGRDVIGVSAVTGQGLDTLLRAVVVELDHRRQPS